MYLSRKFNYFFIVFFVSFFSAGVPSFSDSNGHGDDILRKIREKAGYAFSRYSGVESRREITTGQYDFLTGKLITSYRAVLLRKDYFYKKAEFKALKFVRDGRELPPEKFNYRSMDPVHMPFAKNSDENYSIILGGETAIDGVSCWELEVIPKKNTMRHFSGKIYFTIDGLDLYYLKGTVAYRPFVLKNLSMEIYFKKTGDISVMSRGSYVIEIDVPLFFPHRKIVSSFTSTEDKLIPAE